MPVRSANRTDSSRGELGPPVLARTALRRVLDCGSGFASAYSSLRDSIMVTPHSHVTSEVIIPAGAATLGGTLTLPDGASTLVLFAHGSGSSRHSPRNQFVARTLNRAGLATLP